MDSTNLLVSALIGAVAFLYSTVGHGGASGYLAVLSLFGFSKESMASSALLLNVLVATVATISYAKAGQLRLNLTWPFIVTSIPAAFAGGFLAVSDRAYFYVLAAVLFFAALRLAFLKVSAENEGDGQTIQTDAINLAAALPVGAVLGFLSGMVGVGGGIFLSPVMLLLKWADAKKVAATSAAFIVVNSTAGLSGRLLSGTLVVNDMAPLVIPAFIGALIGSHLGANKFARALLCRILAAVLLLAAVKLLLGSA